MSGTPTEAEIQDQWRKVVDILETLRAHFDSTYVGGGAKFDLLLTALEGTYTSTELPNWITGVRGSMSSCISPATAAEALAPIIYEWGQYISNNSTLNAGYGGGLRNTSELFRIIYEWMHANGAKLKSRTITFGSITAKSSPVNVGNPTWSRLGIDEYNYPIEAVTVEKKWFRCRADQNTGTDKWAETFEVLGSVASYDALQLSTTGSGESIRTNIFARHAGSGSGGSLLSNSSFSEFAATATPKFTSWTEVAGGASVSQDTTNYYRTHPGASTHGSLKITGGAGTVTLRQPLSSMRIRRLDYETPYFLRIMVNKTVGTATGGNLVLRLGNQTLTTAVSALASGWTEVVMPIGQNCWPTQFDTDSLAVDIEWASSTSGFLLVDDAIFCTWDLIDGSYYILRHTNATPIANAVDDLYSVTDTGGAPATGKLQYWLWVSGFGYLPAGVATIADP